jgi:hypothetical protein
MAHQTEELFNSFEGTTYYKCKIKENIELEAEE